MKRAYKDEVEEINKDDEKSVEVSYLKQFKVDHEVVIYQGNNFIINDSSNSVSDKKVFFYPNPNSYL